MADALDKTVSMRHFIGATATLLIAIGGTFINSLIMLREIEVRVTSLEKTIHKVTEMQGKVDVILDRTDRIRLDVKDIHDWKDQQQQNLIEIYKNSNE